MPPSILYLKLYHLAWSTYRTLGGSTGSDLLELLSREAFTSVGDGRVFTLHRPSYPTTIGVVSWMPGLWREVFYHPTPLFWCC